MQKISWRRVFEDFKRQYPEMVQWGMMYEPYDQEQIRIFLPDGRHLIYNYLYHTYRLAEESLDWKPEIAIPKKSVGQPRQTKRNERIRKARFEDKRTVSDIAKEYGISRQRVYKILEIEMMEIPNDERTRIRWEKARRNADIINKKYSGMKVLDIAKEFGISTQRIYKILKANRPDPMDLYFDELEEDEDEDEDN